MKNARILLYLATILLFLSSIDKVYSQDDKSLYLNAVQIAKENKQDFAFMYLRRLLEEFPESEYAKDALFAIGEYYFSAGDSRNAYKTLNQLIKDYPNFDAKPFAISYLLNIVEKEEAGLLIEKLKKELVISQQVSLVFREFEELEYRSALNKHYKALLFIDKIEIYIDNEFFAEITF